MSKKGEARVVDDGFNSQRHPSSSSPCSPPATNLAADEALIDILFPPHPHSDESSPQPSHSSPADPPTSLSFH